MLCFGASHVFLCSAKLSNSSPGIIILIQDPYYVFILFCVFDKIQMNTYSKVRKRSEDCLWDHFSNFQLPICFRPPFLLEVLHSFERVFLFLHSTSAMITVNCLCF